MTLVHSLLEQAAARTPSQTALIHLQRRVTYGELDAAANRFAHALRARGVTRGDRVVIAIDNSSEMVAAYLGTMKAGAIAVPLPGGPRNDRLVRVVHDCSPQACVIDHSTAADTRDGHVLADVPTLFVTRGRGASVQRSRNSIPLDEAVDAAPATPPSVRSIDVDLAAIIYTSGSTGEPRGVMLTHRNFVANARSIIGYLRLTASDSVMCVLPFYYVYGLSLLHTHLAVGGTIVIDNRFAFPNTVLNAMSEHRVTGFAGVPSTFALLLHRSDLEGTHLPDLRYVTQAGGAMSYRQICDWRARVPVPLYVMYGATEAAARLTYLEPSELDRKPGSIGKPIPNVEVVVVTDEGTIARPGEVGELVARGSNVASGYWNDPEETRRRFGPLGYRTGDLGYADNEGFLFLVGRRHDMIKVGAHRVGAKEIEDVLHAYAGVREAAVLGAPHDILGEAPVAVVASSEALDIEALRTFCQQRLAAHKVPLRFHVLSELPKIPGIGKVDRIALRATFGQPSPVRTGV